MAARRFQSGQQVKCRGLNMKCQRTVECVRFVRYLDVPKVYAKPNGIGETVLDCVTVSRDGISVMLDSRNLMA